MLHGSVCKVLCAILAFVLLIPSEAHDTAIHCIHCRIKPLHSAQRSQPSPHSRPLRHRTRTAATEPIIFCTAVLTVQPRRPSCKRCGRRACPCNAAKNGVIITNVFLHIHNHLIQEKEQEVQIFLYILKTVFQKNRLWKKSTFSIAGYI